MARGVRGSDHLGCCGNSPVPTATVSRALRRPGQVKPATRARILEAAQALSYGATRSASSLASGRTERIAILNGGSLAHWFTSEILQGAYTVIRDHQMDLTLYRAGTAAEREQFFRTLPARKNADAMMVVPSVAQIARGRDRAPESTPHAAGVPQHVRRSSSECVDRR